MSHQLKDLVDALLDGELTGEQAERLMEDLALDEEALGNFEIDQWVVETLARRPSRQPPNGLAERTEKAIEVRQHLPAGGQTVVTLKSIVLWIAAAVVGAGMAVGLLMWNSHPESESDAVALDHSNLHGSCAVRDVSGEVLRLVGLEKHPARPGDSLSVGSAVQTDFDSRVELALSEDVRLDVLQSSVIELEHLEKEFTGIALQRGLVRLEAPMDGGHRIQLRVGRGAVLVECSSCIVAVLCHDDGRAAVGVMRDSVEIEHQGGRLDLRSGQQVKLPGSAGALVPEPLPGNLGLNLTEPRGEFRYGPAVNVSGQTDSHARVWVGRKRVEVDRTGGFHVAIPVESDGSIEVLADYLQADLQRVELGPATGSDDSHQSSPPSEKNEKVQFKEYQVDW